jgi:hypothetical protein
VFTSVVAKAIGVGLTIVVAGGVSYATFVGLVNNQVNSAGSNPGDASDPTIDYGQ